MITSITLRGFKSFADSTRLEFGPGITAVIGPNGSGKSNVVEALRWVSHQARAKELRAARATELIFHGSTGQGSTGQGSTVKAGGTGSATSGKAPLGLAEVQLELRTHAGGRLHLARRIYRDGCAEQDIMGRASRAKDVVSALHGTGLGSGGLAVIGQGEVGSVVQAEGETLLAYVQEAAGLARSVAARQDTAARLQQAQTGLAQVRLLEDELDHRVRRLDVAASAARRHRELSLRSLDLQDALARAKHLAALDELSALRGQVAELSQESGAFTTSVHTALAELEAARERVTAARERQQQHAQALELYTAAVRAQAQAEETLGHLDRDVLAVQAELTGLAEQQALVLESPAPAVSGTGFSELQAALAASGRDLAARARQARELESRLKLAREHAGTLAQQEAARQAQRSTLAAEAALVAAQLAQELGHLEATRREGERLTEGANTLEAAHAGALSRLASLQDQERDLREKVQQAGAELPPLRREQARLEASLNSYSLYAEGPRNALRSDHPGIVGSVADLLTVPAEHETAVGAALGRRLEQVVVQSADDAREIIDLLKRSGGRATFLPLDLLRPRTRRDAALLKESGVLGNLSDLCPSDPAIVGQNLLSDTLLLRDLAAATALARRHASRPRLVTVDGELLEPGGALTGGRVRDSSAAVLSDQRRCAQAQDELGRLEQQQQRLLAALADLSGDLEDAVISESVARAAHEQTRRTVQAAALQLAGLEARAASLEAQYESLTARLLSGELGNKGETSEGASADISALEQELEQTRQTADQAGQAERRLSAEVAAAREHQTIQAAHQAAMKRQGELQLRLEALRQRQAAGQPQLLHLQRETARYQTTLGDLIPQELAVAEAAKDALSLAYSSQIAKQNKAVFQLGEARLTQARREGSLGTVPDGTLPAGTQRDWQQALSTATRELETLGTVNQAAAAELQAEQERLDTLSRERQDVEQAALELRAHLAELDATEQQATLEALDRVGKAFAEYSGELLGGLGELELEHASAEESERAGKLIGIRLAVQPRGKRTRNLTLLSAGERTMAGLAFLFALAHAPADHEGSSVGTGAGLPLAVLDEVDAPLDEANIRRFTRFLTLFAARGSQFVVVTHQKATMEVATVLWGVTTDASGASRVLSIRQAEDARVAVAQHG